MKKPDTVYPPVKVLLSGNISKERLLWLQIVVPLRADAPLLDNQSSVTFYLCGDALYSLVHPVTAPMWEELGRRPGVQIIAESLDLSSLGLFTGTTEPGPVKKGNPDILF